LNSLKLLNQVENVVEEDQEPFLLIICNFLMFLFEKGKISSKPLGDIVFLLIIDDLFFVVLVIISSVKAHLLKFNSLSHYIVQLLSLVLVLWSVLRNICQYSEKFLFIGR
jgi:hypothetical protein